MLLATYHRQSRENYLVLNIKCEQFF